MTAHDLADRRWVGRTFGGAEHRRDLFEVVRSEDAGRHHGQELGVAVVAVLEGVDGSARDEDDLARRQLVRLAVDRERGDADEALVDLLEAVMAVSGRHHGVRRDLALKGGRAAAGGLGVEHEQDGDGADTDRFQGEGGHGTPIEKG